MSTRIIVNGASGKMGQETVKAIQKHNASFELVAQTGKTDDLETIIKNTQADIVIDFTNAAVAYDNACTIIRAGARPVIGTSGIPKDKIQNLQQRCAELKRGGIIAPNFSIGAVLMMQFAKQAAKYLSDVEIIEFHHPGKLDAPSGTALKTAEMIAEVRENNPTTTTMHHTVPGSRGASHHSIPIHAVRLPGIVAAQQVLFGGRGETLSIQHNSIDRESFMPGVILACERVMKIDHLVYGLESFF